MRSEGGVSLVEVVVSVAMLALMAALATISGAGFLESARLSRVASQFADNVSIARENAMAKYERWRIRFLPVAAGSDLARIYVLERCGVPVGGFDCNQAWALERTVQIEPGIAMRIPVVPPPTNVMTALTFDRTGQHLSDFSPPVPVIEIEICKARTDPGGTLACRPGTTGRLIRIRTFSGIIET